ncbi:MAG: enoyl-CoA hydratase/isomerase family protein, partial [Actinomycetes bacterium]
MIDASISDGVVVLTMNAEENRFNGPMLDAFKEALDNVESSETAAAVVLTGTGKFFSNGLDLEWMTEAGEEST